MDANLHQTRIFLSSSKICPPLQSGLGGPGRKLKRYTHAHTKIKILVLHAREEHPVTQLILGGAPPDPPELLID